jgi:hypothetical protein
MIFNYNSVKIIIIYIKAELIYILLLNKDDSG